MFTKNFTSFKTPVDIILLGLIMSFKWNEVHKRNGFNIVIHDP